MTNIYIGGVYAFSPGLVDAHTHSIWAGDRVHEFAMKVSVMHSRPRKKLCRLAASNHSFISYNFPITRKPVWPVVIKADSIMLGPYTYIQSARVRQ